jgi:hypothetical protein
MVQRKHSTDTPLSQTNVSLSLSLIRKQCEELLKEGQTELSLEDADDPAGQSGNSFNPYDHSE